ncbi:HD domain-containing protein [Nonomuraea endophytica]|uniref:HD domain-containing protein n=1 Tax=Nonomuraea endophytica TaxID=714136 RepID=UPI0037C57A15
MRSPAQAADTRAQRGSAIALANGVAAFGCSADAHGASELLRPRSLPRCLTAASNEQVTADQVRELPPPVAQALSSGVRDYEANDSLEAACAHDADKLECLLQTLEYRDQGHQNMQPWVDSSLTAGGAHHANSRAACRSSYAHRDAGVA